MPIVPLSMVELEFTESAAMEVSAAVLDEIAALRRDGARIAIDDFGTGYSNLARLRAMPLDRVKLDPSLIADIETNEKARVIVQAVIQLIKGVECEIVAEAVENRRPGRHPARDGLRHGAGLCVRAADVRGGISRLGAQRRERRRSPARLSEGLARSPVRRSGCS